MGTNKEKVFIVVRFLAINIVCSVFQFFVLFLLGGCLFFVTWVSGNIIWEISGSARLSSQMAPIIGCLLVLGMYAVAWFIYWFVLFEAERMKWLYWRVAFATLPFAILLFMYDPRPDPMAMIPVPKEFGFSVLVTGMALFPIYSVSLNKYVLPKQPFSRRNMVVLCVVMILLGSLLFLSSWTMMPVIYGVTTQF